MADFHAAAVRFGKPGILRVAPLGSTEPASTSDTWPTGWVALGYTEDGSVFNYDVTTAPVAVAEELDNLAYATTGRNGSVVFALAEITKRNLNVVYNGGVLTGAGVGDNSAWTFEPPALGAEQRIMLGWDALPQTANNDLRFIFRQCFQGGASAINNRKGAVISGLSATFNMEKPGTGLPLLKILGSGNSNPA
jgi:hypothetical protein